jgi:hypothetical protein
LRGQRPSADVTQSAGTDPIGLPALIVAVIIIVPERLAEAEAPEATIVREPPAGTAEAMTAEPPTTCAADVSRSHRPTEVRAAHAGTQMSATDPAAKVSAAHSAAEVCPAHPATKMAATAAVSTTATARQRVGRDADTSRCYRQSDHRDLVQRKCPHDSFLSFG